MGMAMAMSERLKLTWETTLDTSNDSHRILFFKGQRINVIHPGEDCLIATTEKDFKIRAWSKCGFYGDFIKAAVEKNEADFIFNLSFKADEEDLRISRYIISKTEITYISPNK